MRGLGPVFVKVPKTVGSLMRRVGVVGEEYLCKLFSQKKGGRKSDPVVLYLRAKTKFRDRGLRTPFVKRLKYLTISSLLWKEGKRPEVY